MIVKEEVLDTAQGKAERTRRKGSRIMSFDDNRQGGRLKPKTKGGEVKKECRRSPIGVTQTGAVVDTVPVSNVLRKKTRRAN